MRAFEEMASLAAAASADEVVAAWENLDLCIACQHRPYHPVPALNVLWAIPDHHVLWRFPYQVQLLAELTDDGRARGLPRWLPTPPAVPDAPLEPEIALMLNSCWNPVSRDTEDLAIVLDLTVSDLLSRGYVVELSA